MKTSTKAILAGLAITVVAGTAYAAQGWRDGPGRHQRFAREMFDRIDADKDGAISSDELMKAIGDRFDEADKDANASVTKAEIIAAIEANAPFERARRHSGRIADRIADRIVYQLDLDDNGDIARAELENRAKKVFALFDRNDDGKVEIAEIRHMAGMFGGGHGMRHGGWGGPDRGPGSMHFRWGDPDGNADGDSDG